MNPFKYIKCLFAGHNVLKSKSICDTTDCNNWLKKCNCCGLYVMHSKMGSITFCSVQPPDSLYVATLLKYGGHSKQNHSHQNQRSQTH